MTFIKFIVPLSLVCIFLSCNNETKTKEEINKDSIVHTVSPDTTLKEEKPGETGNIPDKVEDPEEPLIRLGRHDFTLHWISWDRPGQVNIEAAENGWHPVSGSQRDGKGNFVSINGELQVINPLELRFRGVILTKVETINNGDTCTRTGDKKFLSTKNRKYWRLQEMENCEGGRLVDYIDIYF